jgi:ribonuclease HI
MVLITLAELMALRLTLLLAVEKDVNKLRIFGDSLLVIKSVKQEYVLRNFILQPVLEKVLRLMQAIAQISFHHIFREMNRVADGLSKEGVQLAHGEWIIQENADCHVSEYADPPFD